MEKITYANFRCHFCVEGYCSKRTQRVNNKMFPCNWVRPFCKKHIPRKLKKGVKWDFWIEKKTTKSMRIFAPDFDKELAEHGLSDYAKHLLDKVHKHYHKHRQSKWERKAGFIMSHWREKENKGIFIAIPGSKYTDTLNDYWDFLTASWNLNIKV